LDTLWTMVSQHISWYLAEGNLRADCQETKISSEPDAYLGLQKWGSVSPCGPLFNPQTHIKHTNVTNRFSSISFLCLSFSALYAVGSNRENRDPKQHVTQDANDTCNSLNTTVTKALINQ